MFKRKNSHRKSLGFITELLPDIMYDQFFFFFFHHFPTQTYLKHHFVIEITVKVEIFEKLLTRYPAEDIKSYLPRSELRLLSAK